MGRSAASTASCCITMQLDWETSQHNCTVMQADRVVSSCTCSTEPCFLLSTLEVNHTRAIHNSLRRGCLHINLCYRAYLPSVLYSNYTYTIFLVPEAFYQRSFVPPCPKTPCALRFVCSITAKSSTSRFRRLLRQGP